MFKINTIPGQAAQEKGYARYPEDFPHLTHGADFAAWSSGDDWEIETILDGQALVDQWNSFCKCCENGIRVWEVKYQHQDGSVDFLWYGNLVDEAELPPIFAAILEKLVEPRQRLITHSPYNKVPFRLRPPDMVELDGSKISRQKLAGMDDVMALLDTGAPAFASLEPVRERYEAEFGNELCWTFPVFHNGNSGCVLLPVQEGILYLPYTEVSSETYEQFDLQDMGLLTKGQAQALLEQIRNVYSQLFCLLSDMQAFGLAQGGEGDHG